MAQTSLESQLEQTNIVLLAPATEPLYRSSPRYSLNLLIGGFLGAVLGFGLALMRELSDRRLRDEVELVELLGVPVLGTILPVRAKRRLSRPPALLPRPEPSAP